MNVVVHACWLDKLISFSEQERNAPYSGKGNECVNDTAEDRILTAENPRYQVELEQTYTAPVKSTYDHEDQR